MPKRLAFSAIRPGMLRHEAATAMGLSVEELLLEASLSPGLQSALEKSRTHAVATCMSVLRKAMAGKEVTPTELAGANALLALARQEATY